MAQKDPSVSPARKGSANWSIRARLPRDHSCAWIARRLFEQYARDELLDEDRDNATLIVSELVTNAYRHGAGAIVLNIGRTEDRLRLEVCDEGHPGQIDVVAEADRGAGGYGLWLVEQLTRDWGVREGTTHVWAELMLGKSNREVED